MNEEEERTALFLDLVQLLQLLLDAGLRRLFLPCFILCLTKTKNMDKATEIQASVCTNYNSIYMLKRPLVCYASTSRRL